MTLLETMVSFLVLLLVSLYLMSMFASGQHHWLRAQQYSIANQLVHRKLQEALASPLSDWDRGPAAFESPYQDYHYTLRVTPDESDLLALEVEVTGTSGVVAHASTLCSDDRSLAGIAVDPYTNRIAFVSLNQVATFNDDATQALVPGPALPLGTGGTLAGVPGSNFLWLANLGANLAAFHESPAAFLPAVSSPPANGLAPPRFSGAATDRYGNVCFVGDSNNRCLWIYRDSASPKWDPAAPVKPLEPALGSVAGVSCDSYGHLVWLADRENQCLRKLIVTGAVLSGPALEASPGVGYWHRKQFKPGADVGMGSPQGVAVDPYGWAVYVVDRTRLYRYLEDRDQWDVVPIVFPADLIAAQPSGLALDPYSNALYINGAAGQLWKLKLPRNLSAPLAASALTQLWKR